MTTADKLCLDCFNAEFPGKPLGTVTWGRVCTKCRKPTPMGSFLVKVTREEATPA